MEVIEDFERESSVVGVRGHDRETASCLGCEGHVGLLSRSMERGNL